MRSLSLAGTALALLPFLGGAPAHAADVPSDGRSESVSHGGTLSLGTVPDSGVRAAAPSVECGASLDLDVAWWWDASRTLTRVAATGEGQVACDPAIHGIASELYVRHDATLVPVDTDTCVSEAGAECATSTTAATHTCTAGTACAGDWTTGLEVRLWLNGDSWDADSFPDHCTIEGADDEIARCYLEVEPPIHVPPTFPADTGAAPAS
ncbi:hypothetical protein [Streptomyces sp. B6B3]|uniref:hypothetical protein n=1 Tax=Streptomyces sp. B6B3 TaxID=3153570 RepID=UPI00325C9FF4